MDLIELQRDKLSLGMTLRFTLRDESGGVLLGKGNQIESPQQLAHLKGRKSIFIAREESDETVRMLMSGLADLDRADAPIKDFSKYLQTKKNPTEEKITGTFVQRWSDVESRLGGLLANIASTTDFEPRLRTLAQHVQQLLTEDVTASQFLLFNRAVSHFNGYSVLHSMLCAALTHSLSQMFSISDLERHSLICAALTMNCAMTSLQDELTVQKAAPNPHQRRMIDNHAAAGRQMLIHVGVLDMLWLETVEKHHATLTGPDALADWPQLDRMAKILQIADRYTAAMSPRKSRSGRTARDSVKTVIIQTGSTKHDEVGSALVRILGLSPPGTYVKLANGETAVVMRRGPTPNEPLVASVLNRNDEPIAEPRLHDTAREKLPIVATLVATTIRVNLKMDQMLRLMPKQTQTPVVTLPL
jgi:HD-GYP domain-containing protein (c-di-GMP phosphodiesterase class II)